MTIRHMRIFLAVCRCGNSVTEAARSLYMTQPSVTQAIREIESHYGVRLFDRISRRLYLTEAGRSFREYSARIISIFDDMEDRMRAWDGTGTIRIGASMTVGAVMMADLVGRYGRISPGIEVRVRVEPSRILEEKLLVNELDLALIETPSHHESLIARKFGEDELTVIVPRRAPYRAGIRLGLKDLAGILFVLREEGSGTRLVFDEEMRRHGQTISPVWEAGSTTALVSAVAGGIGISVVPRVTAEQAVASGLVWPASIQKMHFTQSFYIVSHKDKFLTPALEAFIALAEESGDAARKIPGSRSAENKRRSSRDTAAPETENARRAAEDAGTKKRKKHE